MPKRTEKTYKKPWIMWLLASPSVDTKTGLMKMQQPAKTAHNACIANPHSTSLKYDFQSSEETPRKHSVKCRITDGFRNNVKFSNTLTLRTITYFYETLKSVYGSQRRNLAPVKSAYGITFLKDKHQVVARWAEHFISVLNQRHSTDPAILDTNSTLPTLANLDEFS